MKRIRFTKHALQQCSERGATKDEIIEAVHRGIREPVKHGRFICRANFQYNRNWQGEFYAIKQVAPVIVEEKTETVIIEDTT